MLIIYIYIGMGFRWWINVINIINLQVLVKYFPINLLLQIIYYLHVEEYWDFYSQQLQILGFQGDARRTYSLLRSTCDNQRICFNSAFFYIKQWQTLHSSQFRLKWASRKPTMIIHQGVRPNSFYELHSATVTHKWLHDVLFKHPLIMSWKLNCCDMLKMIKISSDCMRVDWTWHCYS